MTWKYYQSIFEYEKSFPDLAWPWAGHKYFIYDLIKNILPQTIVELGTHKGTSFFSMCQPIKDDKLKTKLYAIDSWHGEKHSGLYDEFIFNEVKRIKKKYYNHLSIFFLRNTFDKAKSQFRDHSIDILHIDGLHTYEAVKHDFYNWFNKVKNNGIIILHDIKEQKKDFAVYILWEEIKKKYITVEFNHSHGLGIIFLNKEYKFLTNNQSYWQMYYSALYQKNLGPFAEKMQIQLDQQTAKSNEYLRQLNIIKSAKFYKHWQNYCNIRKKFKNLIHL